MKITGLNKEKVKISSISRGELFLYEGAVYMKTNTVNLASPWTSSEGKFNCVDVATGTLKFIKTTELVEALPDSEIKL